MGRKYTHYTARGAATVEQPYTCPVGCGYVGMVSMTMTASASRDVGGWHHDTAEHQYQASRATMDAQRTAGLMAKGTLKLTPCPRCGQRASGAVARHVIIHAIILVVFVGAAVGLGFGAASGSVNSGTFVLGGLALCALIIAAIVPWAMVATYREAQSKAIFREAGPEPTPWQVGMMVWALAHDGQRYVGRIVAVDATGARAHVGFPNGQVLACATQDLRLTQ